MKKRIVLAALTFVLVMSLIPVTTFAANQEKYTKVKESQFPKLTQGKLTKRQVEVVIDSIICHANLSNFSKPLKLSRKQIKKLGKEHMVKRIALYGAKTYYPPLGQDTTGKTKEQWCEAHDLKESNRIFSFFTDYRFKKKQSEKNYGYYRLYTSSKRVYFYGGIGWGDRCEITSAKKYAKKVVLNVQRWNYGRLAGKYTVTLTKQKNGRFGLNSIKETWRPKSNF